MNKIPRHIILLITYETSLEFRRRKRKSGMNEGLGDKSYESSSISELDRVRRAFVPPGKRSRFSYRRRKDFLREKKVNGIRCSHILFMTILTYSKIDHSSRFPRPKLKNSNLSPLNIRVLRIYHAKTASYELMGMSRAVAEAKNALEQSEVDSLVDQHYVLPRLFHDS